MSSHRWNFISKSSWSALLSKAQRHSSGTIACPLWVITPRLSQISNKTRLHTAQHIWQVSRLIHSGPIQRIASIMWLTLHSTKFPPTNTIWQSTLTSYRNRCIPHFSSKMLHSLVGFAMIWLRICISGQTIRSMSLERPWTLQPHSFKTYCPRLFRSTISITQSQPINRMVTWQVSIMILDVSPEFSLILSLSKLLPLFDRCKKWTILRRRWSIGWANKTRLRMKTTQILILIWS